VIDYERALRSFRNGHNDVAWGPNNKFVFPSVGGTGEIYRRIAAPLADRIHYRRQVLEVNPQQRRLRTADGGVYAYDPLVSTMPLDLLVGSLRGCPDALRDASRKLRHNSVYMVGVGYEPALADEKSWMFFPQDNAPFTRRGDPVRLSGRDAGSVPRSRITREPARVRGTVCILQRP
jgi:UDP-galactopyranose mutase